MIVSRGEVAAVASSPVEGGPAAHAAAGPLFQRTTAEPIYQRSGAEPIYQRSPASRRRPLIPGLTLPAPGPSSGRLRIDRSTEAASASTALAADAFTAGDTIVVPSHHGPLDRGRGQALLAHELVHVGQQRRLGGSLPPEGSDVGQQLEREAQAAEPLVAHLTRGPRPAPMPVAAVSGPGAPPVPPGTYRSEVHEAVGLALAIGSHAASGTSVDLPSIPPMAEAIEPRRAASANATSPASDGAASNTTGGGDERDLEDLARRLYEPLRHRLRQELLLDRERGGSLVDAR